MLDPARVALLVDDGRDASGKGGMHVVTGGAGFIGTHLVAALRSRGTPVRIVDLAPPVALEPGWAPVDIREPAALAPALAGVDTVYHLAADSSVPRSLVDPAASFATNLNGTLNVLTAARDAGVRRVVLASSCAVYGDPGPGPATESQAPSPLTPYAMAKLTGEQLAAMFWREHGVETVSLRFFNVYGPGQPASSAYAAAIPAFVAALRSGQAPRVFGDGLQTRDFVAVDDVVCALQLAAVRPGIAGRVFNAGTGQATRIRDLAATLAELLGLRIAPELLPARAGDIRHSVADPRRATAEMGFTAAIPLAAGLAALLAAGGGE